MFLAFFQSRRSAFFAISLGFLLVYGSQAAFAIPPSDKIAARVMSETADGRIAQIVITLTDHADVTAAYAIADHDERGGYVYNTLRKHAERTQAGLKSMLKKQGRSYRSFWAANILVADADQTLVMRLAQRADVARIESNAPSRWLDDPEVENLGVEDYFGFVPAVLTWGVENVNAPGVWSLGFNGQGMVIGGLDTGIRGTHNAIRTKYRGWNGTTADHNYNWHDAIHNGGGSCGAETTAPCDDGSHGTHTIGTVLGDDGAGNQIGVAPGAKWVGCRNMNLGFGTPASYTECFQFMMAPTDSAGNNPNPALRPHIVNNSWACTTGEGCTARNELEQIINSVQEASGIFVVFSAGNGGSSGCSTVSTPGAIYQASFSVGAYDSGNSLASFSSRGPSTYYTPNLLKPNLSAPGVGVMSALGDSDGSYGSFSGTSMAAPHVAGVIALLWSARPHLVRNIAATKTLLQNTANPSVIVTPVQTCGGISSTQIPNNSFGYGRIDALAAVNAAVAPTVTISGVVSDPTGRGMANIIVRMIDAGGNRRTAVTGSFGGYIFTDVPTGAQYRLTVGSRRFSFDPQTVAVNVSPVTNVNFEGEE